MRTKHTIEEKTPYYLLEFNTSHATKSQKTLLMMYLRGGRRYYYYKNERRTHNFKPLIDEKHIIGAGKGAVMTTREGFQKLRARIENLKIKIKEKGVFYK